MKLGGERWLSKGDQVFLSPCSDSAPECQGFNSDIATGDIREPTPSPPKCALGRFVLLIKPRNPVGAKGEGANEIPSFDFSHKLPSTFNVGPPGSSGWPSAL